MVNPFLNTFVVVADTGSFAKASELLFISQTAVMKQMNALENHLGLKLMTRTRSGIKLTKAGEEIYKSAVFMIDYSKKAIVKAKLATNEFDTTFCVGTSLLNPAKPFMDIWYQLCNEFPNYKIHIVPFDDNHEGIISEIKMLGVKFDFLIGVNDSKTWNSLCSFTQLGTYKKMIGVSRSDPLASKKKLTIQDLYGRTLMMVEKGDSNANDKIRDFLETKHPEINIESAGKFYDMFTFNKCADTNKLLLTTECWKDVHPGVITLPIDWDFEIPYGLLYANDAPEDVIMFAKTAEKISKKKGR